MLYTRPATFEDCELLAPRLRRADVEEIQAGSGLPPLSALQQSFNHSRWCFAIQDEEGVVHGLFGVCESRNPDTGCIWMMGSDAIARNRFTFIKQSKAWFKLFHKNYKFLWNFVHEKNTVHVQWLSYMGCQFVSKLFNGFEPFLEFVHTE